MGGGIPQKGEGTRVGNPWGRVAQKVKGRGGENISDYLQNLQIIIKIFTISTINIVENLNTG